MLKVTPAQYRVLSAIRTLYAEKGYSPSYADIAAFLGVSSPAVWKHIDALQGKGYLTKQYGQRNTIELVGEGAQ